MMRIMRKWQRFLKNNYYKLLTKGVICASIIILLVNISSLYHILDADDINIAGVTSSVDNAYKVILLVMTITIAYFIIYFFYAVSMWIIKMKPGLK